MKGTSTDEYILREKLTDNGEWNSNETVKFTKLTGEHLFQRLLSLQLYQKKLWYTCFPINFAEFFRTTFLQNFYGIVDPHLWDTTWESEDKLLLQKIPLV